MITVRQHVANVAYRFTKAYGNTFRLHTAESPSKAFDARATRIAEWYMREKSMPHHYLIQAGYVHFRDVINAQYEALSERIRYEFTSHDPISDPSEIHSYLDQAAYLPVVHSAETGGHPVWDDDTNNRFRAVHDTLGHYLNRVGFDKYGEDAAYRAHAQTMPRAILPLLVTETRGQNSALNYGNPIGEFKEQKAIIAPDWMI